MLCYVDHHDKAYAWAEKRRLETHPTTGAAQFVEIRETVKEIVVPAFVPAAEPAPAPRPTAAETRPFAHVPEGDLLAFGVPSEWLRDVIAATERSLLALIDHLPAEAAEALLDLATGGTPRQQPVLVARERPEAWPEPTTEAPAPLPEAFEHPDAQRRFRVVSSVEELQRALEFPWDKWTVYLHPEQRQLVERQFSGPAKVAGSAGTGKTIVALHRAVHLARSNPDARVLLTTFSDPLANALRTRLARLVGNEPRLAERIDVEALPTVGKRLHLARVGPLTIADDALVRQLIAEAATAESCRLPLTFLLSEWAHVVDAWQVPDWPAYRDLVRLGRKVRLPEPQRASVWAVFERVRAGLRQRGVVTQAEMFTRLADALAAPGPAPYTYAVVDEAQDLSVPQLRFLAALGRGRGDALFFAGDTGQRIFQQPFSWKALGIDVRGRSRSLRVNYRTSQQIRVQADRLLEPESQDADGETERRDAVSVFSGPPPEVWVKETPDEEAAAVGQWLRARLGDGVAPHECAVFVRSDAQLPRAEAAVKAAGATSRVLDGKVDVRSGAVHVCTMHLAKGLEFRAVVVMACDDEVLPLQERIEAVGDDGDLQETYNTERQLLYVACTRARDFLLVSGCEPASEFLDDLRGGAPPSR